MNEGVEPKRPTDLGIVEKLLIEVMQIERHFGHDLRNVNADRREKVRDVIEKLSRDDA